MGLCEQGYLCEVCGGDVRRRGGDHRIRPLPALRTRRGAPEKRHILRERHVRCNPTLAQLRTFSLAEILRRFRDPPHAFTVPTQVMANRCHILNFAWPCQKWGSVSHYTCRGFALTDYLTDICILEWNLHSLFSARRSRVNEL